ncbi:MAG: BLUF domain-containing protein [Pandoraea sp.]|nr:BLUF domain-containing protein [Pandoraea sp.]MDR3398550.1 BLUF domain-containing protein [Pandoraea sp.]
MTECYAYLSRAVPDLDLRELSKIIVNSRGFNATYNITGVLLFDGAMFYQYIEGPSEPLADARQRIDASRNHTDIQVLLDGTPAKPGAFPTWSLGYLMLDEPAHSLHAFVMPADRVDHVDHPALVAAFAALAAKSDAM